MATIGISYEETAVPAPQKVVDLCVQNKIRRIRIYKPNYTLLAALGRTKIEVMLGVPNAELPSLSSSLNIAKKWIKDNVTKFATVKFRYIVVGDSWSPGYTGNLIVQAMKNLYQAIDDEGQTRQILVTTVIEATPEILVKSDFCSPYNPSSDPPSDASFNAQFAQSIEPVISLLSSWVHPLLVKVKSYDFYVQYRIQNLDFALFTSTDAVVYDGPLEYKNLFDVILDATYVALSYVGAPSLEIVAESGWPTAAGGTETAANLKNASAYNNNLIGHVTEGTPRRPGKSIKTYISSFFDNNFMPAKFGVFLETGTPKYKINF